MKLQHKTILITGGSSGLGLELALRLAPHNKVLICGRSAEKLKEIKSNHPEIEIFQCELSERKECERLAEWIANCFPECSVLINNAAVVHTTDFYSDENAVSKAEYELQTNFLAPLILIKQLLPVLERNPKPALINVTTGLVYVPRTIYPFYNATKAALHSFTQTIRMQMKEKKISVVEVMFPAVDTPWHKGNPPKIAIAPSKAIDEMLQKLERGKEEIRIGKVSLLYVLSRIAPGFALRKLNAI